MLRSRNHSESGDGFLKAMRGPASAIPADEHGTPAIYIPSDGPWFDLSDNGAAQRFLDSIDDSPGVVEAQSPETDKATALHHVTNALKGYVHNRRKQKRSD